MFLNLYNSSHVESDHQNLLARAGSVATSFWSRFINPSFKTIIRLSVNYEASDVLARAREPYSVDDVMYGEVNFNTRLIDYYPITEIVATVIHELGHILGFGWGSWLDLFDSSTGFFLQEPINTLPNLSDMKVETGNKHGTTLAHWDESLFELELMTGKKRLDEYISPITIDVMSLLGHQVKENLYEATLISDLLPNFILEESFSNLNSLPTINKRAYIEAKVWEEIFVPKQK